VTGVVVSFILVEGGNCLHFFSSQLEVENVDVLGETLWLRALWDCDAFALHSPAKADLSLGFIVFFGSVNDGFTKEARVLSSGHFHLNVAQATEVRETNNVEISILLSISEELLLSIEGVQLDLQHGRLNLSVLQDIVDLAGVDVAAADVSRHLVVNERLHCVPGVLVASLIVENHRVVIGVHPLRRILALNSHELLGNGEVNQVQIEVLKLQICEGLLAGHFNLISSVEGVPQLADDEKIFSINETFSDGAFDTFTDFLLITVVTGTVEESVTSLNCVVDSISAHVLANLPKAKAE